MKRNMFIIFNISQTNFELFLLFLYFWQEEAIKKKYGGMLPRKPPLISKVAFLFEFYFPPRSTIC